jgi:ketosteroid isomerase-like protein
MSALDVVNRFYEVTDNRAVDELRDLVADDVTFEGPLMQAQGASEYVAMNQQLLPFHRGTRMLHQFVDGDSVCSIYELDLKTPQGGDLNLEIADCIQVKEGKIASQRIYFDPRAFDAAFGIG